MPGRSEGNIWRKESCSGRTGSSGPSSCPGFPTWTLPGNSFFTLSLTKSSGSSLPLCLLKPARARATALSWSKAVSPCPSQARGCAPGCSCHRPQPFGSTPPAGGSRCWLLLALYLSPQDPPPLPASAYLEPLLSGPHSPSPLALGRTCLQTPQCAPLHPSLGKATQRCRWISEGIQQASSFLAFYLSSSPHGAEKSREVRKDKT